MRYHGHAVAKSRDTSTSIIENKENKCTEHYNTQILNDLPYEFGAFKVACIDDH